jgi:hypothetical protein
MVVFVLVLFAGQLLIAEPAAAATSGARSTRSWSLSSATKCNVLEKEIDTASTPPWSRLQES